MQPVVGLYSETIHQLAARRVLQELEEGVGYLHSRRNGAGSEEVVKNEGVRVGLRYGVASKWTRLLVVQREEEEEAVVVRREDSESVTKRTHQLKDALAASHATHSDDAHPLLRDVQPKAEDAVDPAPRADSLIEAYFGALSVSDHYSRFFGASGGTEVRVPSVPACLHTDPSLPESPRGKHPPRIPLPPPNPAFDRSRQDELGRFVAVHKQFFRPFLRRVRDRIAM
jgi:hypothetical protein